MNKERVEGWGGVGGAGGADGERSGTWLGFIVSVISKTIG
jgi:hypothetical protein